MYIVLPYKCTQLNQIFSATKWHHKLPMYRIAVEQNHLLLHWSCLKSYLILLEWTVSTKDYICYSYSWFRILLEQTTHSSNPQNNVTTLYIAAGQDQFSQIFRKLKHLNLIYCLHECQQLIIQKTIFNQHKPLPVFLWKILIMKWQSQIPQPLWTIEPLRHQMPFRKDMDQFLTELCHSCLAGYPNFSCISL